MSEAKLPRIIADDIPEFEDTIEDDLRRNIERNLAEAEDEIFVKHLEKLAPGEVFFIGEPKYIGKMTPPELVPCRPPQKAVHAIAHFDFEGSCRWCPCFHFESEYCNLAHMELNLVLKGNRHEHCPLCIEED